MQMYYLSNDIDRSGRRWSWCHTTIDFHGRYQDKLAVACHRQAVKKLIEPIFEANFRDNSYGFRPKRSAQQAVNEVKRALITGWWVVDADIQSYFDTMANDRIGEDVVKLVYVSA